MISFGPIPSRRLGKSLGINNIVSPKTCTYNCVYCQVGKTMQHTTERDAFFLPEVVYREVERHLGRLKPDDYPDYLTFVSNGEPTLDLNLGESITRLKTLGIPVAVITNASLLNREEVRSSLALADWVSVKVDAANEATWKKLNRPVAGLSFDDYWSGVYLFADEFFGTLCSESMLVRNYNDDAGHLKQLAGMVKELSPQTAYLSIPIRPPAEKHVGRPAAEQLNTAWQLFNSVGLNTELLTGFEGVDAGYTGNAFEDILNITAVHPLREDALLKLLENDQADESVLQSLLHQRLIDKVQYRDKIFYLRHYNATS